MKDVARLAGVAPITVSRALRGDSAVQAETRNAVRRAASALGYIPNHAARTLSARGSKLVALIVPNVANSVFAETIDGLNEVLSTEGFAVTIGYSGYSREREEALVRSLLGYKPDGIILTGFTHTRATRALLRRARIPVVETWNIGPKPLDMAVGFSNYEAARAMTRYLVSRGYDRLGYAGGTQSDNDRTCAREQGFRKALAEAGLPIDEAWVSSMPMELSSGAELARRFVRADPRPNALFVASDIIASGFVLECGRLGIRIPGDVAVAGFDGAPLGAAIQPQLTTVGVPQREIGRSAASLLLARLKGPPLRETVRDLGFEIIARASA